MRAIKCDECGFSNNDDRAWSHLTYHGDNTYGGPANYGRDFCPDCTDTLFRALPTAEPSEQVRRRRGVYA